jgi:capsid protein
MQSRKKVVADRFAGMIYALVLEEEMGNLVVPMPRGIGPARARDLFYLPLAKEALTRARWIGAGRGQIDEVKETQAAILRIRSGLSTREIEIARLGEDYREIFAQLEREQNLATEHTLVFDTATTKPNDPAQGMSDTGDQQPGDAGTQNQ